MTTTLIKAKTPSSLMAYFTGMGSVSLKMVSILIILFVNITNGTAQNSSKECRNYPTLNRVVCYQQKIKAATVPVRPITYTLHDAKHFPKLECPAVQALHAMDDAELFDYEMIFGSTASTENTTALAVHKASKKAAKTKMAPKLRS